MACDCVSSLISDAFNSSSIHFPSPFPTQSISLRGWSIPSFSLYKVLLPVCPHLITSLLSSDEKTSFQIPASPRILWVWVPLSSSQRSDWVESGNRPSLFSKREREREGGRWEEETSVSQSLMDLDGTYWDLSPSSPSWSCSLHFPTSIHNLLHSPSHLSLPSIRSSSSSFDPFWTSFIPSTSARWSIRGRTRGNAKEEDFLWSVHSSISHYTKDSKRIAWSDQRWDSSSWGSILPFPDCYVSSTCDDLLLRDSRCPTRQLIHTNRLPFPHLFPFPSVSLSVLPDYVQEWVTICKNFKISRFFLEIIFSKCPHEKLSNILDFFQNTLFVGVSNHIQIFR